MPIDGNAGTLDRMRRNWQRFFHSHVFGETPAGAVNGSNTVFLLTNPPRTGVAIYQNGSRLTLTIDYSIVGKTITMVTAPTGGDVLLVDYIY